MGKAAAFFDLEGTLTRDSTDMVMTKAGYRTGFFSFSLLVRGAWEQLKYSLGLSSAAEAKILGMRLACRGRKESEFLALGRQVFESTLKANIYQEAIDTLEQFRADGVDLYIISTTYCTNAIPYAEHLGIEHCFASTPEVDDAGVYTGEPVLPIHAGEQKGITVQEIADREGYDLAECYAYGDSQYDQFMLAKVGHPFAVNPKRKLRVHAEREGWGILSWSRVIGEEAKG